MKKATIFALSTCLFLSSSALTASAAPVEKHQHKVHVKEHEAKEHKAHVKKHEAKEHKMRAKSKAHKVHTKSIKPKALPKTGYGGVSE
ncbi:hypothetical protein JCM10914A_47190 [Paenibacillus sp. JCM 10914]|uniref:hypothetical protein n=1 Tax=Paenibacillus sp. JCM 10914 TaxID=1236974 RepID=UPI0003CC304E|nr:hypothetical protein [Paenibacillus sp. JCM 10914]GAE08058.1 hypothetical protein JCM10914_4317 [Paenibacillus sp. JCM 10914]